MTAYGVTPTGFVLKPVTQIVAEVNADLLGNVENDLDLAPDQPLGQVIGILSAKIAEGWEILETAYNATNRGNAENDLLDNIGDLTGTKRLGETHSLVPCNVQFSLAGTYPAGALVASLAGSPSVQFRNVAAIVVPSTGGDGSPIGSSHSWPGLTSGVTFLFESIDEGPIFGDALIAANAGAFGHLNQRVPVAGWLSVADAGDVTVGTLEEEDPPYRVRQQQDLAAPGNNTIDATAAAILLTLASAPVPVNAAVQMYENTTFVTDPATGLPPKSYMAVVGDDGNTGNNQRIANAIWANKPGGMQSYGSTTMTVVDKLGVQRTVYFSRPTAREISITMDVYVDPSMTLTQRTALGAAIRVAIANASQGVPFTLYGSTFTPSAVTRTTLVPGRDVIANAFRSVAQGQDGVVDIQAFTITSPPTETNGNVLIGTNERGLINQGDVTVTVYDFVP